MLKWPLIQFIKPKPKPAPVPIRRKPARQPKETPFSWVGFEIDEDFIRYRTLNGDAAAEKLLNEAHSDMMTFLNRRP